MELEIRRHIQNDPTPIFLEVQSLLMHNEDVLFIWSIIGCDWEEEESAALLPMVVTYWTQYKASHTACITVVNGWKSTRRNTNSLCRNQRVFGNNYFHRVIQHIITYYHYIMILWWKKIVQDTQPRQINSVVIVVYSHVLCNLITVHFQFLKLYKYLYCYRNSFLYRSCERIDNS